jgi:hypothetical protein
MEFEIRFLQEMHLEFLMQEIVKVDLNTRTER